VISGLAGGLPMSSISPRTASSKTAIRMTTRAVGRPQNTKEQGSERHSTDPECLPVREGPRACWPGRHACALTAAPDPGQSRGAGPPGSDGCHRRPGEECGGDNKTDHQKGTERIVRIQCLMTSAGEPHWAHDHLRA
jgi:hypothetical protein